VRQQQLVELAVAARQGQTVEPAGPVHDTIESPAQTRLRRRYETVHELAASGLGAKAIARDLNLARGTVRRYLRTATVDDLLNRSRAGRPSRLDPFITTCTSAWSKE